MDFMHIKILMESTPERKITMANELMNIKDNNFEYTSMQVATVEDKKKFYNAVENPTSKLSEYINKEIIIKDVSMVASQVQERDDVGNPIPDQYSDTIKTVIVTPEGNGIISTSMGLARALVSMFRIFGTPDTWESPMRCVVKQVDVGKSRTFKLEVV